MDTSTDLSTVVAAILSLTAVVGAVAVWLADRLSRRARKDALAVAQDTVEDRLDQLAATMRDSARLLEQVSAEIEARAATAQRLKDEAETAERVAQLNAAQRDAVARIVRSEVAGQGRRANRQQLLANALFFVAGALISLAITLFVDPLG